ncbi:hypothetical protein H9Q13_04915 [Pontibacter sp. JH31]|uniref:SpoIIAA-like n=1 Tax=Pontibacter aquaedesilientis TaxID=2766980 RepID=A0ABR7XDX6_9BACT|nr:hypothetical protein [Pontibacter aquaedesilientis]MBD1396497.1 hypothetical protein [Pontibacter aquaedesilientis]
MGIISIQHDPSTRLLLTKWLRAVGSHEYRESILSFYKSLSENKILFWVVDITRLSCPNMLDQKWTTELLGPGICKTQLQKIAFVLPDDLFLELVTEKMVEEVLRLCEGQVEIGYFRDYEQAFNWLHVYLNTDHMSQETICFDEGEKQITP